MHSVLLIEDDHQIRVTLRELLEADGYSVFTATHGADGLAILKNIAAPCAVILDQMMPVMDGEEFLKIKSADPAIASIPVIVMSAMPNRTQQYGTVDFIKKPMDIDVLKALIQKHCTKSH